MNKLKILLCIMMMSTTVNAGSLGVYGGFFAFNEKDTDADYKGLSPLGYFGVRYTHQIDDKFSIAVGAKHESSPAYREEGGGFNGVFIETELKLF